MENDNNLLMLGLEIDRVMKLQGFNQADLAKIMCKEYPQRDNGKDRNFKTTKNNISQIIRGVSIHADTLDKVIFLLKIKRFNCDFEKIIQKN